MCTRLHVSEYEADYGLI